MTFLGYLILVFIGIYGLVIVVEYVLSGNTQRFLLEGVILLIALVVFVGLGVWFAAQTPPPPLLTSRILKAPDPDAIAISPVWATVIMVLCTVLGIIARQIFYHPRRASVSSYLRPLVIAPIIFFPLIGTVQGIAEFTLMQVISFGILAFQNGFFWKEVFEKVLKERGGEDAIDPPEARESPSES
ncbi:hypothetical protein GF339_21500 [candidate division KSB3 bacterium]|uniref:Uncharacterized protein n=1 Tax=candidate division KSB3 bacterium TaxID=2044937 RepID=A0A9D5K0K3_9BACT|nr:hypothetical protein [candidate division KSB3 bacterium]MBD3327176.1 hypothetical protein [candidate division KSB3 bacterium]